MSCKGNSNKNYWVAICLLVMGGIISSCQRCATVVLCPYQNPQYISVENGDTAVIGFPNAFTPNGDGVNDFFRLYCHDIKTMDCQIYDAAGHKIYESNQLSEEIYNNGIALDTVPFFFCGNWDGRINNKTPQVGIYAVRISATTSSGKQVSLDGTVSLLGGKFFGDSNITDGNFYMEWKNGQFPAQFDYPGAFIPGRPSGEYSIVNEVHGCF